MSSKLGYLFHPSKFSGARNDARLEVNLLSRPTHRHYDPEQVTFLVTQQERGVDALTVTHPWRGRRRLHVIPGRIVLRDRKQASVQAFSFGGQLVLASDETLTNCMLVSPAPIWPVGQGRNRSRFVDLVCCLEMLIARRRAAWTGAGGDSIGFELKLAALDPLALFGASLAALAAKMAHIPQRGRQDDFWRLRLQLQTLIQQLEALGNWPPRQQLDELL